MPSMPMTAEALVKTVEKTINQLYDQSDNDDREFDDEDLDDNVQGSIHDFLKEQSLECIGWLKGEIYGAMGWAFNDFYFLGKTEAPNPIDSKWHLFCLNKWDEESWGFCQLGERSAHGVPLEQAAYELLTKYATQGSDEESIVAFEFLLEEWRCKMTGEPRINKFLWRLTEEEQAQLLERGKQRLQAKDQEALNALRKSPEITPEKNVSFADRNLETDPKVLDQIATNMVAVEGGEFLMGAGPDDAEADTDERPQHLVKLDGFHISRYPVTQAQWVAVMGNNPSYFSGCDDCPVEQVSWNDIQDFIRKLNQQTGKNYRLPTEAEWEFAARGGNLSKGYRYAGSDDLSSVAWYLDNSGGKTRAVGQKQANELGIYDMSGNVWEWCEDWSGDYSSSAQTNPKGPLNGERRVLRGDSFDDAVDCRVSLRGDGGPDEDCSNVGFRLVLP